MVKAKQPISEDRRAVFLEVLRRTGSVCAAASAASPHCDGDRPGYSGFRDLAQKDPVFSAAVAEAKAKALGKVETTIADMGSNPSDFKGGGSYSSIALDCRAAIRPRDDPRLPGLASCYGAGRRAL